MRCEAKPRHWQDEAGWCPWIVKPISGRQLGSYIHWAQAFQQPQRRWLDSGCGYVFWLHEFIAWPTFAMAHDLNSLHSSSVVCLRASWTWLRSHPRQSDHIAVEVLWNELNQLRCPDCHRQAHCVWTLLCWEVSGKKAASALSGCAALALSWIPQFGQKFNKILNIFRDQWNANIVINFVIFVQVFLNCTVLAV